MHLNTISIGWILVWLGFLKDWNNHVHGWVERTSPSTNWKSFLYRGFIINGIAIGMGPFLPDQAIAGTGTRDAIVSNKLLETYRLYDQLEDDAIDFVKTNKQLLLLPIIKLYDDINAISCAVQLKDMQQIKELSKPFLAGDTYTTPVLKKVFNRYADNIFYNDPERMNIYLGGGAVPDTSQTTQYLLRNEILNKIDDVRIDLQLLVGDSRTISKENIPMPQLLEDTFDDCRQLIRAFDEYISKASPDDVKVVTKSLRIKAQ